MTASYAFESILSQVQSSCLNFKIELSPFSAIIHLKKSFLKNQFGETVLPPSEDAHAHVHVQVGQAQEIKRLVKQNEALEEKLAEKFKRKVTCSRLWY